MDCLLRQREKSMNSFHFFTPSSPPRRDSSFKHRASDLRRSSNPSFFTRVNPLTLSLWYSISLMSASRSMRNRVSISGVVTTSNRTVVLPFMRWSVSSNWNASVRFTGMLMAWMKGDTGIHSASMCFSLSRDSSGSSVVFTRKRDAPTLFPLSSTCLPTKRGRSSFRANSSTERG